MDVTSEMATIDVLLKNKAIGAVAQRLMSNGRLDIGSKRPFISDRDGQSYISIYMGGDPKNPKSYRTQRIMVNATLRRDEWKALDAALLGIAEQRLGGAQDLIDAGLVYTLGNAMGTTVLEYHDVSDAMEAVMTMDGVTRGQGDRPVFTHTYLPIPIIHVDYEINARELAASRGLGNPLDTINVERAGRRVLEKVEDMLFTSTSYAWGGGTIYSYLNFPDRNTYSLGTAWDSDTAANILADVIAMKQASINDLHYGPWVLYIPTAYETTLDEDYSVSGQSLKTIRQRILDIEGIKKIKVVDRLTANNVLLVELKSDTVRLVRGMGLQNIEWSTEGGMVTKFKVMTIQVPQIRSDANGRCGIVHGSV
jgi:hypothetical protein